MIILVSTTQIKKCISVTFFFFFSGQVACGILVPQTGIEPRAPAGKAPSPKHWTAREVPHPCNF